MVFFFIRLYLLECIYSFFFCNVFFWIGWKVGIFINYGVVKNVSECVEYCCLFLICDVVFMIFNDCFFVCCYSDKFCEIKIIWNFIFYLRMIFVKKYGVMFKGRVYKVVNDLLVNLLLSFWWSLCILIRVIFFLVNVFFDLFWIIVLVILFYVL